MTIKRNFIEIDDVNHVFAHITKKRITVYQSSENGVIELFHIVLSVSNRKIGKITNYSIMPGETCAAQCMDTCYNHCYDMASVRMYPTVREARIANTYAVKHYLDMVTIVLDMYLTKYKPELFRIHVGGDFFSTEYFDMWITLVSSHTSTTFLAYTKQYDVIRYSLNYCKVEIPANFCLYISLWKGIAIPYDLAHVLPTATVFGADYTDTDATVCPGSCASCKHCYTNKPVVFIPHGNGISKNRHDELEIAAKAIFKTYNK